MKKVLIWFSLIVISFGIVSCGRLESNINDEFETTSSSNSPIPSLSPSNDLLTPSPTIAPNTTSTPTLTPTPTPTPDSTSSSVDLISSVSDKNYHPIILAWDNNANVIGGSIGNEWYPFDRFKLPRPDPSVTYDFTIDLIKGSEEYNLYSTTEYIQTVKGTKLGCYFNPSSGQQNLTLGFEPSVNDGPYIGVSCDWDAISRLPKIEKEGNSTKYVNDLDNDGTEESILVNFIRDPGNAPKYNPDDYIRVFDIVNNYGDSGWYNIYFLDLNGDNKLEVILVQSTPQILAAIYEFNNGKIEQRLAFYDGD